jgi:DNA-binding transcriptional MocR family regulator
MTTTDTRRTWNVDEAWARYNELNPDTGTRLHSVRSLAQEIGVSHTAVATAFREKRGGHAPREALLPYEVPRHMHRSTTGQRLRMLAHRHRGDKLPEREARVLDHWLASLTPGLVVVYDVPDNDWAWRRPLAADTIVFGIMTSRPDEG